MKKSRTTKVHSDLDNEEYHDNLNYYNSSRIKLAKKSLAHLKHHDDNYNPDQGGDYKEHFEMGKAFESILTDDFNKFKEKIAVTEEDKWIQSALENNPKLAEPTRSKVYREEKEQFITENEDKIIVSPENMDTLNSMLASCLDNNLIKNLVDVPVKDKQTSIFWKDPATGLLLKTRPDILNRDKKTIIEIKTIDDGSPSNFFKKCANLDYILQAALQIRGVNESGLFGEEGVKHFFWLVVEKNAPFNAVLYRFQHVDIVSSMDELDILIDKIAKAKETGVWSGYEDYAQGELGIIDLEIPLFYNR